MSRRGPAQTDEKESDEDDDEIADEDMILPPSQHEDDGDEVMEDAEEVMQSDKLLEREGGSEIEEELVEDKEIEDGKYDIYYNQKVAYDHVLEFRESSKEPPSLAVSKEGKKKLVELIEREFIELERREPKPPPTFPFHIRMFRSIKRRIYKLPPDTKPMRKQLDIEGFMNAAARDKFSYLMNLIDYEGYPADLMDDAGRSGLWYAALNGCEGTLNFLLNYDRSMRKLVDVKDNIHGWTPLHICCTGKSHAQVTAAKILLEARADVDIKDNRGRTPLILSILSDNLPLAELLIEFGASLDKRDRSTWMALHHAVYDENEEAVELLLENQCRYKRKDGLKMRAIDWAERKGYLDVADILRTWEDNHTGSPTK